MSAAAAERVAEVVSVQGQGETRPDERSAWQPAAARQALFPSHYVRTGALSRMGLLFEDRTQVRLAEKTLMQIKAVARGPAERTVLRLEQGRTWSQTNAAPSNLYLETPSATAAIRGTDFDLEVFEGGRSLLTVLSGEAEFFNDFGRVSVARNEQAYALPGQAPVKVLIANPRDRVQWVTAYALDPQRHLDAERASPEMRGILGMIRDQRLAQALAALDAALPGATDAAPYLIASDLMVQAGRLDRAKEYALRGLARFREDPRLAAQHARVSLAAGEFDDAQARLAASPSTFETRLVAAELARARGEAEAARAGYVTTRDERPVDDRPWHGIGVVDSEREAVASARVHLSAALERNPAGPGYQGELGTLETFADRFAQADASFRAALAANPSDYVALTGLGLLELKRGHPEAALENFLRASVLEPRYARAHVFGAVANYQLGRREIALRELQRASELDDKDPLPYLLASMIHTDAFRAKDAIESARRAMELLPYLKSLNQIANDRQGSANLGRSLSFFGLEEWAQSRAQESYFPYWAGSHLFLSDRYPGQFNKNSELMQGFITDPTVFGSSNRFQSLVPAPGNYGRLLFGYSYADDSRAWIPIGRANGLFQAGMPVAYLVDADATHFRFTGDNFRGPSDGRAFTAAIGARPMHELGLFAYGFDTRSDDETTTSRLFVEGSQRTRSFNGGIHYRPSPRSQLWLRAATLSNRNEAVGIIDGAPIDSRLSSRLPEQSLRHTFDAGRHQLTWGLESAHKRADNAIRSDIEPGVFLLTDLHFDERSRNAYVSDTFDPTPRLRLQADAWWQENRRSLTRASNGYFGDVIILPFPVTTENRDLKRVAPRVGIRWRLTDEALVRAAYQDWVRPMGTSTLGPVATAGIPMDDRLVARGGRQKRARVQLEWEASRRTFASAFADWKEIDNLRFSFSPFLVEDDENLSKLREFDYGRLGATDLYEFISAPEFDAGRISIAGAAVNHILTDVVSVSARYQYTDSRNTGSHFPDRMIAYHARNVGAFGLTFVTPRRVYFTTRAVYRTRRYTDEANVVPFAPGWDASGDIFWESHDKRLRLRAGFDNAFHKERATLYHASVVVSF